MSNLGNMAHTYKNRITLEEIIYSSGLLADDDLIPFWKKLVLKYQVREWRIYYSDIELKRTRLITLMLNENAKRKQLISNSRLEQASKQSLKHAKTKKNDLTKNQYVPNLEDNFLKKDSVKIILMEKNSSKHYIFYYKVDGQFYKIILQPNLSSISYNNIKNIFINNENFRFKYIDEKFNIFKVIENIKLTSEKAPKILTPIFKYNPLIYYVNNARYANTANTIDSSIFYANEMLNIKKLLSNNIIKPQQCTNLYNTKPWIYKNFTSDNFYLERKKDYLKNNNNKNNNKQCFYGEENKYYYEVTHSKCNIEKCDSSFINCVYYNVNKSGYDIIEKYEVDTNKFIIWIIPTDPNNLTTPYLANILDLNREIHIKLLEGIKELYETKNMICFAHNTTSHTFFCLHFHITKNDNYKRQFPYDEFGTYIIQDLYINDIIEKLKVNNNYFKNYNNVALIRQQ